jgi:hypothetical protein
MFKKLVIASTIILLIPVAIIIKYVDRYKENKRKVYLSMDQLERVGHSDIKMKAILILGGILILIPIVFLILIASGWLVF